jgi:hypothetical protein
MGGRMDQLLSREAGIQPEPYLDARQAGGHLGISSKLLLRLARAHKVPAYGLGDGRRKMWRFSSAILTVIQ